MHAIPNHQNSNFQIIYFLAGSCHTPDGAYALLCNLRESRESAIGGTAAAALREQAKRERARAKLTSKDISEVFEGRAEIAEIDAAAALGNRNRKACEVELAFINKAIERINPHRKFKHLADEEANQAAQFDEWKLELVHRAENHMLTSGTIPADHFATMRMHPAYLTEIVPAISAMKETLAKAGGHNALLTKVQNRNFDVSKMLALPG